MDGRSRVQALQTQRRGELGEIPGVNWAYAAYHEFLVSGNEAKKQIAALAVLRARLEATL